MASPAAREPEPLVTFVLCRTVAKVDSIVILSFPDDHRSDLGVRGEDGVANAVLVSACAGCAGGRSLSRSDMSRDWRLASVGSLRGTALVPEGVR
jgi:hypothetical protein